MYDRGLLTDNSCKRWGFPFFMQSCDLKSNTLISKQTGAWSQRFKGRRVTITGIDAGRLGCACLLISALCQVLLTAFVLPNQHFLLSLFVLFYHLLYPRLIRLELNLLRELNHRLPCRRGPAMASVRLHTALALQRNVCASKRTHSLWFQRSPPAVHPDLSKWKPISARHTHLCSASLSLIAFCLATRRWQMFPEDRQYLITSDQTGMNLWIYVVMKHPCRWLQFC